MEGITSMKIAAFLLIYLCCSILSYGLLLADMQNRYSAYAFQNCRADKGEALFFSLIPPPISLIISFGVTSFAQYGIQYRCNVEVVQS